MSRLYGIRPADLDDLTVDEVEAYLADVHGIAKERERQRREAQKRKSRRR